MEVAVEGAAHCSMPSCVQYDFLPTKCSGCEGKYCSEHSSPASHECRGVAQTIIVCPVCNQSLTVPEGVDPNVLWNNHNDNVCTGKRKRQKKCSECGITLNYLNIHTCRQCNIDYCLKHRLQEDHPCTAPTKFEPKSGDRNAGIIEDPTNYLKRDSFSSGNSNENNGENTGGYRVIHDEDSYRASSSTQRRYNQGDDVQRDTRRIMELDEVSLSGLPTHVDAPDDGTPLMNGKEGRLKKLASTLANLCNYQERRRRRRRESERNTYGGRERDMRERNTGSRFPELSDRARNTSSARRRGEDW